MLILSQLLILFYSYPKHFCLNELIDDKLFDDNTMFWNYDNKKYKVKKSYNELLFYSRIISFILDLIVIISEFIVLYNLKRIKSNMFFIIILQLFRISICVTLIYYEYTEKICEKTSENNIFYRKEKKFDLLETTTFIYDIGKIFIC